jgi:O-antigen/teichoic acid export membrane protein
MTNTIMPPTKASPLQATAGGMSESFVRHLEPEAADAALPVAAPHAFAPQQSLRVLLSNPKWLMRWSARGFWAILDQGLFALSNLLVNVLLARWLPAEEYGAFVTAYTVLLLVSVIHSAFLGEPMLVFGSDKYNASFSHYLSILRGYHWRLMFGMSLCVAAFAIALVLTGHVVLGHAAAGLALTGPCVLLSWLARRACYVVGRPRLAAFGGAVSLTLVIFGTVLLARLDLLTVLTGQLLQGVAALAASALMLLPLRRVTTVPIAETERSMIWSDHWQYGRWIGATGLVGWFNGYIYYFLLPIWGGLAAAGALKAIMNLVMPILQSDGALVTLLTPTFVRSRRVPGQFARVTTWSAVGFAIEALVYWALLVLLGQHVVEWVYKGAYQFSPTVVVLVGMLPLLAGLTNVLSTALRASERPDGVFWATMVGAIVVSTVGVFSVSQSAVTGAVVGLLSANVMVIAVMLWLLKR